MVEILPLHWIAPPDDGSGMGQEDCLLRANGMGGKYAISTKQLVRLPCGEGYLLWDVEDPFIFTEHETIEAAQSHAQADHEKRIRAALKGGNDAT